SARADVGDELDVRSRTAQEAREAVRAFVDDAALAGLPTVRVVHGRGTGPLRAAGGGALARAPARAPALSERRWATSSTGTRSSRAARATPPTARRWRRLAAERRFIGRDN